ncbi:MAG: iron ABC transporter permease [Ignavibacteria bacterium]|nr:iron ABC transporter permease [Ignavibacteria bacterium]
MNRNKLTPVNIIFVCLILFFVIGYILFPLFSLLKESFLNQEKIFSFSSYESLFSQTALKATFNSILLSVITVIGSGLIGIYFAYIFQYHRIPNKSFFSTLLLIPLATPPLIGVVAFLFLLNESGLVSKLLMMLFNLQHALFRFDGWTAIIIIHIYSFYTMYFLFVASALKKIDTNLIDASYSMGATKTKTFFKIILPQLIPAVIGASLITFMASMASFSAPFIFGGSDRFLTTEIFNAKINGDNSFASSLSVLLTIISILFLILLRWYRSKKVLTIRYKSTPKTSVAQFKEGINYFSTFVSAMFTFLIMLPIMTLLFLSFIPEGSLMRNFFEESFTISNYSKIFSDSQFFDPFKNSIGMAIIAVVITLIIGVSSSFLIAKKNIKGKNFLESILSLPYGIPGTVIALSFILSFNTPTIFTALTSIVGTFWILPLAYAVRNLPLVTQSSIAGFHSIDPSLEEASQTLGASGFRTFKKIIVPLIFPSVLNGALLVFINSVGEFVSTILLYSYSTKTISVEIYSQIRMYNTGAAASYGIILFLMVMVIVYFSRKTLDKSVGVG